MSQPVSKFTKEFHFKKKYIPELRHLKLSRLKDWKIAKQIILN